MFDYLRAIRRRTARLDEITRGLSVEAERERQGYLPLHIPERRLYLESLHEAIGALDAARKALATAALRIEDEAKTRNAKGRS